MPGQNQETPKITGGFRPSAPPLPPKVASWAAQARDGVCAEAGSSMFNDADRSAWVPLQDGPHKLLPISRCEPNISVREFNRHPSVLGLVNVVRECTLRTRIVTLIIIIVIPVAALHRFIVQILSRVEKLTRFLAMQSFRHGPVD